MCKKHGCWGTVALVALVLIAISTVKLAFFQPEIDEFVLEDMMPMGIPAQSADITVQ